MTVRPYCFPDDWVNAWPSRRLFPVAAAATGASTRPTAGAGRGSTLGRVVAVATLAACVVLLWPSIRGER